MNNQQALICPKTKQVNDQIWQVNLIYFDDVFSIGNFIFKNN